MSDNLTIERSEFVRIVDQASEGCVESTRASLRAVAETTVAAPGLARGTGEVIPPFVVAVRDDA